MASYRVWPLYGTPVLTLGYIRKFFGKTFSSFSGAPLNVNKEILQPQSEEVRKFERIASDWWNPNGEFHVLHDVNPLRVQFIRNGFMNNRQIKSIETEYPLHGLTILDIGCGGGILSQPLGRLGAKVLGLDAGKENIVAAEKNLPVDLKDNVTFTCSSIEDFSRENPTIQFDGVIGSEVIEHVEDPKLFVQIVSKCVKPSGSIFITTFNRTTASWLFGIVVAEHILGVIPKGTHDWRKFLSPEEIQFELSKYGCKTTLIHGIQYNVFCNSWDWSRSTAINYALHAVKNS